MKIELSDELWVIIKLLFVLAVMELLGWGIYGYLLEGNSTDWGDTPLFIIMIIYLLFGAFASMIIKAIFGVIHFFYENINFVNK